MFVSTNGGLCNLANAIKITSLHRGTFRITFVDETEATIRCDEEEIHAR